MNSWTKGPHMRLSYSVSSLITALAFSAPALGAGEASEDPIWIGGMFALGSVADTESFDIVLNESKEHGVFETVLKIKTQPYRVKGLNRVDHLVARLAVVEEHQWGADQPRTLLFRDEKIAPGQNFDLKCWEDATPEKGQIHPVVFGVRMHDSNNEKMFVRYFGVKIAWGWGAHDWAHEVVKTHRGLTKEVHFDTKDDEEEYRPIYRSRLRESSSKFNPGNNRFADLF